MQLHEYVHLVRLLRNFKAHLLWGKSKLFGGVVVLKYTAMF